MIKLRNKKGAIGATLTWIVATVIVFFIMIIYIFIIGLMSGFSKPSRSSPLTEGKERVEDVKITKALSAFLLSPVELVVARVNLSMYELIQRTDIAKGEEDNIYRAYGWKIITLAFPRTAQSSLVFPTYPTYFWLRVYEQREIGKMHPRDREDVYNQFHVGDYACKPNEKTISKYPILRNNEKRYLVLCMDRG